MSKLVIFVDDSATVLMSAEMACEELVESGVINLKTYSNPLDCLNDIKKGLVYDLLITDINMPQMNGLNFAKELKTIPAVKLKPIIALTTENSQEMKENGKAAGLVGWISKPFTNEKLLSGLKRVMRI
jgi:two-component system chemotaxis response regulator CheY